MIFILSTTNIITDRKNFKGENIYAELENSN